MEIDWFTFGAQIVNFVILIALLKRFLYGPILEAMDRREEAIANRLEEARARREEAAREAKHYRSLQETLQAERQDRLAAAEQEAEERRRELVQAAREDVEYLEAQWRDALRRERTSIMHAVSERALEETVAMARRALTDLADADLEARAVDVLVARLRDAGDDDTDDLAAAFEASGGRATLRSAFPLPDEAVARIQAVLREAVGEEPDLSVETDDDIGFGVELRVEHRRVAWTLDGYLDHLLERVEDRLDAAVRQTMSASPPKPVAAASRPS